MIRRPRSSLSRLRPARSQPRTAQALGAEMANQINRLQHMRSEHLAACQRVTRLEQDIAKAEARIAQLNLQLIAREPALAARLLATAKAPQPPPGEAAPAARTPDQILRVRIIP